MFSKMVNLQAALLIYLACGVLCRRLNIITQKNQQQFINLILMILMPCMVFNSFKSVTAAMLANAATALLVALGVCLFSYLLGKVLYRPFPAEQRSVLRYGTLINNAGFAGLPLVQEIFGDAGMVYASVFLIPIRVFMWSAGLTMLSDERTPPKELTIKLLKNPCIIAVFLGLARGMLQINLPVFADTAISKLSACVSPFSMLVIGAVVADTGSKELLNGKVLLYTVVRLLVLPLCTFGLGTLLRLDALVTGTALVLTSMPASTTTALLSARYGADAELASQMVLVTTAFSLVTAPLLILLL